MTPQKPAPQAVVLLAALLCLACSGDAVAPSARPNASVPALAKGVAPTTLSVTSAAPSFGDLGTTVDVHITGSGFVPGAAATWLLHGVPNSHVQTNRTTYVSSTEVVANITIASDAQLDLWDVQVAAGGKNGVGSECFEVTSAQVLGTPGGDVSTRMMTDQGQVVGWADSKTEVAWIYDDAHGLVNLGAGAARGIDESGMIAVGNNGSLLATAWISQLGNSWTTEILPRLAGSIGSAALSAAPLPDGSLLVPGYDNPSAKRGASQARQSVAWRRVNGAWTAPTIYATPAGAANSEAHDANPLGEVVGQTDASLPGIVWESPTTYVQLDGRPNKINRAGTLIVGQTTDGRAVFWWKDPVTHDWHPVGVRLPTLGGASCLSGDARGVNDAGVIVGHSCNGSTGSQATVWLIDLSGPAPVLVGSPTGLPGLGTKSASAADVTNTMPYIVVGAADQPRQSRVAVRWVLH